MLPRAGQAVAPVLKARLAVQLQHQCCEQLTGALNRFRQPQQIAGHNAEQGLAQWIGAAAFTEEAVLTAGDHQPRAPGDHRQAGIVAGQFQPHQQVAELAVLVGLVGVEPLIAIHHPRSCTAAQSGQISQPCRPADASTARGRVVNL